MTSDRETCQLCTVRLPCRGFPMSGAKPKILPDLVQFIDDNRDAMLCLRNPKTTFSTSDLNGMGAMKEQGADDD